MLHFPTLGNVSVILQTAIFIMLLEHLDRVYSDINVSWG